MFPITILAKDICRENEITKITILTIVQQFGDYGSSVVLMQYKTRHLHLGWYAAGFLILAGQDGWFLSLHRQWLNISRFHCHLSQINVDKLLRKVFKWAQKQNISWSLKVAKQYDIRGLPRHNDINGS